MNRKYCVKISLSDEIDTASSLLGLMNKGVELELHGEGIPVSTNDDNIINTILNSICHDNVSDISDLQMMVNDYIEIDPELQRFFHEHNMFDEKPEITSEMIKTTLGSYTKIKRESSYTREECSICLCKYKENEGLRTLNNCKHYFHKKCIDKWFKNYSNECCPICRDKIF